MCTKFDDNVDDDDNDDNDDNDGDGDDEDDEHKEDRLPPAHWSSGKSTCVVSAPHLGAESW